MPHIVIEYSANLENRVELHQLVREAHEAALASGVFEIGGLRTRCARRDVYRVADGHPDNSFIAVNVRIGHGRDEATRHRAGKMIFDAICAHLKPIMATTPIGITLDVAEIDKAATFKQNNMHGIVKARREKAPRGG
ncbi:MAG: 5-carboxymethyl-2-hydroxymuconate Delta-isomerase [Hyphomicrobiales bacterium]|nr:5-carboxymethyl-2-hydroxymuconate Delta-isomerase [Hyphomicrobiales bacterium]